MAAIGSSTSTTTPTTSTGSATTGDAQGTLGDAPPITFPGVASGLNVNSIIEQLTSLTLLPAKQDEQQITQINAKNAELIKISGLLNSLQNALTTLSNPTTFDSFVGISSDSSVLTATGNNQTSATTGAFTILSTHLATNTSVTSALSTVVGQTLGNLGPGGVPDDTLPLDQEFTAVTPTNGSGALGEVTIDGVQISYNVGTQSLNTILAHINASVSAVDAGFSASYNPTTDEVTFSSTDAPVSLGSPSDQGNLLTVLKLDVAQVNNTQTSGSVTSAGPVGGLNEAAQFNATGTANLLTSVSTAGPGGTRTANDGFFTINGVQIDVNPSTDNLATVLQNINSSAAGVTATYNQTTNQITLVNTNSGPQSIVLGGANDTSNFLQAVGLTPATGASESIGQQSSVQILQPNGTTQTIFSSSNAVTAAIPGITLNLLANSTTPTTVTVKQNTQAPISAINTFVSAYNAAINEINTATAVPVVQQNSAATTAGTGTTSTSSKLTQGGVLFGDFTLETIKDQIISLASSIENTGSGSIQSLSAIGLNLDSTHDVISATSNTSSSSDASDSSTINTGGPLSVTQEPGTDGALLPLDVTTFDAAFAASPNAVASLFSGASGIVQQLGSYLTSVTGLPTQSTTGLVGTIPAIALLQNDENGNTAQIQALQQFVTNVQDQANAQANLLRAQFTSSESLIEGFDEEQSSISQLSQGV
jgi:flagellar capping protein FliD